MTVSIPLRRVVLFKHGLGYFERRGKVKGDDEFRISFGEKEINDVLKSLMVDYGGGRITAVDYEAVQETSRLLEKVGIHIPVEDSLTSLLKQLMGARISLTAGTEELTGRIMGVETTEEKADFSDLFGEQLECWQAELELHEGNSNYDIRAEVDALRQIGTDFFAPQEEKSALHQPKLDLFE